MPSDVLAIALSFLDLKECIEDFVLRIFEASFMTALPFRVD